MNAQVNTEEVLGNDPGLVNLLNIFSGLTGQSPQ